MGSIDCFLAIVDKNIGAESFHLQIDIEVNRQLLSSYNTVIVSHCNAQYTSPTRLNCRVELRRRCVLNSQLFHDGFGRKIEN